MSDSQLVALCVIGAFFALWYVFDFGMERD
jgi:hypothetical protein